jgi:hypothetical protein
MSWLLHLTDYFSEGYALFEAVDSGNLKGISFKSVSPEYTMFRLRHIETRYFRRRGTRWREL